MNTHESITKTESLLKFYICLIGGGCSEDLKYFEINYMIFWNKLYNISFIKYFSITLYLT